MGGIGRALILAGVMLIVVGVVVTLVGKLPVKLGRLPGDIYYHGKNGSFYFPVVTCVLISVVVSLVMWLLNRR